MMSSDNGQGPFIGVGEIIGMASRVGREEGNGR